MVYERRGCPNNSNKKNFRFLNPVDRRFIGKEFLIGLYDLFTAVSLCFQTNKIFWGLISYFRILFHTVPLLIPSIRAACDLLPVDFFIASISAVFSSHSIPEFGRAWQISTSIFSCTYPGKSVGPIKPESFSSLENPVIAAIPN